MLRGKPYQYSQEEILKTLKLMLATAKFEFDNRSAIAQVIKRTEKGKVDFADDLIGGVNHENGYIYTVIATEL